MRRGQDSGEKNGGELPMSDILNSPLMAVLALLACWILARGPLFPRGARTTETRARRQAAPWHPTRR
jgi:hypothetical protein